LAIDTSIDHPIVVTCSSCAATAVRQCARRVENQRGRDTRDEDDVKRRLKFETPAATKNAGKLTAPLHLNSAPHQRGDQDPLRKKNMVTPRPPDVLSSPQCATNIQ